MIAGIASDVAGPWKVSKHLPILSSYPELHDSAIEFSMQYHLEWSVFARCSAGVVVGVRVDVSGRVKAGPRGTDGANVRRQLPCEQVTGRKGVR